MTKMTGLNEQEKYLYSYIEKKLYSEHLRKIRPIFYIHINMNLFNISDDIGFSIAQKFMKREK